MKPTTCRACGQPVINVLATDIGLTVTLDPTPLTIAGGCYAVLSGRSTYDVIPASKRFASEVLHRLAYMLGSEPQGAIHADHTCGQPIPAAWSAPPPPPAPRPTAQTTKENPQW